MKNSFEIIFKLAHYHISKFYFFVPGFGNPIKHRCVALLCCRISIQLWVYNRQVVFIVCHKIYLAKAQRRNVASLRLCEIQCIYSILKSNGNLACGIPINDFIFFAAIKVLYSSSPNSSFIAFTLTDFL